MALPDGKPTEKQIIEIKVASIAIGEIPLTHSEFGELIWKVFRMGERHNELEEQEK